MLFTPKFWSYDFPLISFHFNDLVVTLQVVVPICYLLITILRLCPSRIFKNLPIIINCWISISFTPTWGIVTRLSINKLLLAIIVLIHFTRVVTRGFFLSLLILIHIHCFFGWRAALYLGWRSNPLPQAQYAVGTGIIY